MKRIPLVIVVFLAVLSFAGCPMPDDGIPEDGSKDEVILDVSKDLTAFGFLAEDNTSLPSDKMGVVNAATIAVTVPCATDVTALTASFVTTGKSVTVSGTAQTSGTTVNDFSVPLAYRVTAEDSTFQDYTVTVTIAEAAVEGVGFGTASDPGDSAVLILTETEDTLTMIYAMNQSSIIFPTVYEPTGLDTATATLTAGFWLGETELTNAVAAAVLQWAWKNDKFSSTLADPGGLDATGAKHGGQKLLDMADDACRVSYDELTGFSVDSGYENNPLTNVTWYGCIMLCNWLTEMRDGGTANVVYSNIDDTSWNHEDTIEDIVETGYRLPSHEEWEYAARYLGTAAPTVGNLATEYVARNVNGGDDSLTEGYCWTPGVYAAGATAWYYDAAACCAVAVYSGQTPVPTDDAAVKSLGAGGATVLGLYDMSGNVEEWCFTDYEAFPSEFSRKHCGGSYDSVSDELTAGYFDYDFPNSDSDERGLRFCRTAE